MAKKEVSELDIIRYAVKYGVSNDTAKIALQNQLEIEVVDVEYIDEEEQE